MKKNLIFITCVILYIVTVTLTWVTYNSLTKAAYISYVGTQENYSWSVVKLYTSTIELRDALIKNEHDEIAKKIDILFSQVYVLNEGSESTKYLYYENDFKPLMLQFTSKLTDIDREIESKKINSNKIERDVDTLIYISRKILNSADHALVSQKNVSISEYTALRDKIRNTLIMSHVILLVIIIITLFRTLEIKNNLKSKSIDLLNKNAFLGKLGHEMRSSLQVIIGTIDLMMQEHTQSKNDNILRLLRASEKIERQMKDLSDYAKIDSNETPINNTTFNLYDLIRNVIQDNNIRFSSNEKILVDGDDHLHLYSDKDKIAQIIDNLVSNSFKYAKNKNKKIIFSLERESLLSLDIYDEGIGIKADKIKYIFTPFYRTTSNEIPGVGMGLAIVKGLTDVMNGQISVDSKYGKGTHFNIKLPVQISVERPIPRENEDETITLKNLSILVIDDDIETLNTISDMLYSLGQVVTKENDPNTALRKLRRVPYDLVITDLQMPNLSGLEIIENIKSGKGPNCMTPFIIISAYHQIDEFNSHGRLCKPVRKADLISILNKI